MLLYQKIIIILILPLVLLLISCSNKSKYDDITTLTFETVDYFGGEAVTHFLDFKTNEYKRKYRPYSNDGNAEYTDLTLIKTFTDDEKEEFFKGISDAHLLSIKNEYKNEHVYDGGGWTLIIEFKDGEVFTSNGSNASPEKVFNKCSTYFYDLCGTEIMGMLPTNYKEPPRLETGLRVLEGEKMISGTYGAPRIILGNYKWNKKESSNINYYDLNIDNTLNYNYFKDGPFSELCVFPANPQKKLPFLRDCVILAADHLMRKGQRQI